jgi:hypothetical protein
MAHRAVEGFLVVVGGRCRFLSPCDPTTRWSGHPRFGEGGLKLALSPAGGSVYKPDREGLPQDQSAGTRVAMAEYQVRSIGKKCAVSGETLAPGAVCYSALVEQNGELTRLDYSAAHWKGPPQGAVGHWKLRVPLPVQNRKAPLDPAALISFFEQLTEEANPVHDRLRYVVALLLIQKRRFRLDGSRSIEGEEWIQVSGMHGEGAWEIRDYPLSEEEAQSLQQELNARLAVEFGELDANSAGLIPSGLPAEDAA